MTYIGNLRPALERLGVDTHVAAEGELAASPDPLGVDLSKTRPPHSRRFLFRALGKFPRLASGPVAWGWVLAQALNELGARRGLDLLEMEETFGAAWYAQQGLDVPVVVRLHGPRFLNGTALGLPVDDDFRRIDRAEGRCIVDAAGVTAPSRDVLERVRSWYGVALPHASVIPNPVPIVSTERRWRLDACDGKTVLFVGRFDRHKAGDLVIDAFREIGQALPQAELAFVGPDRGLLTDSGTQNLPGYLDAHLPPAIRARARILGALPSSEIEGLRRQAFVTLVASRYENCSLALAESLAFGCPTVASDAGGNSELLHGEKTGLLFANGDASDLAAKVLTLFAHPERAAELGRNAAADMAQRMAPEPIARATLDYYETVWRDRSPVPGRHNPRRALYALTSLV